jgi:hypothetical protein
VPCSDERRQSAGTGAALSGRARQLEARPDLLEGGDEGIHGGVEGVGQDRFVFHAGFRRVLGHESIIREP